MADEEMNTQQDDSAIEDLKERIFSSARNRKIDPELGIDIVNSGLVYGLNLDEKGLCTIDMTLTTMGCPLTDVLTDSIHQALAKVPEG